jgi:hypothetical protein
VSADTQHALTALLDRLIPAVGELPAAGAMGIASDLEAIAAAHGAHANALAHCLAAVAPNFTRLDDAAKDAAIRAVESAQPDDFGILLRAVYIAYYSHPEVHKRIGWRTGPLQPAGFALAPFEESVLATVRQRAPFWRKAPE